MQSLGLKFLASLAEDEKGMTTFLNGSIDPRLFTGVEERDAFTFVQDHALSNGVIPALETIEEELDLDMPPVQEPPSYYLKKLETRNRHQTLKKALVEAQGFLKSGKSQSAFRVFEDTVNALMFFEQREQIIEYKSQALPMLDADLKHQQLMGINYGIRTGWDYLDEMSGGYIGGDYISVVGRPGQGKTYLLLYMAIAMWKLYGKIPVIVSMEMHPKLIVQRASAMITRVPQKLFKTAQIGGKQKKHVYSILQDVADDTNLPPFYVIDGNLKSSPKALHGLCRQLKPDCMLIDGAYLLKDSENDRMRGWEKIKGTVEETKQRIAGELGVPCIGSFQFNRQFKSKDIKAKPTMDDIGGSDAIAQISTMVIGLMQEDSVETLDRKTVQVLKGRSGETGAFEINWLFEQFPYMDFSQIKEDLEDEDLKYI